MKFSVGDIIIWGENYRKEWGDDMEGCYAIINYIDNSVYGYTIYRKYDKPKSWECRFDTVEHDCELASKLHKALL